MGTSVTAAEGERVGEQPESLRQKDREPEGVLESPARTGADGVTLSGLGQGGKSNAHPRQGGIAAWRDSHRTQRPM